MTIRQIDSNQFRLTAGQAKQLCATGKLPWEFGYETRVDMGKLKDVDLVAKGKPFSRLAKDASNAGVVQIEIQGKPVWVLRLYFSL